MKPINLVFKVTVNISTLVFAFRTEAKSRGLSGKHFSILLNGQRIALSGKPLLSRTRRKLTLTLATAVRFGEVVQLSYSGPKGDQTKGVIPSSKGRDQKIFRDKDAHTLTAARPPAPSPTKPMRAPAPTVSLTESSADPKPTISGAVFICTASRCWPPNHTDSPPSPEAWASSASMACRPRPHSAFSVSAAIARSLPAPCEGRDPPGGTALILAIPGSEPSWQQPPDSSA
ncbi:hypothetical protein [Aphanothece microscopica]|uniref:hypothetical protein n=1 Tax=Aphanothece microscopica TaxID=1049561 RepID=UPI0039848BDE